MMCSSPPFSHALPPRNGVCAPCVPATSMICCSVSCGPGGRALALRGMGVEIPDAREANPSPSPIDAAGGWRSALESPSSRWVEVVGFSSSGLVQPGPLWVPGAHPKLFELLGSSAQSCSALGEKVLGAFSLARGGPKHDAFGDEILGTFGSARGGGFSEAISKSIQLWK